MANDETGRKAEPRREYVDRVLEGTHRYAQDLMTENERLRLLVATLESERGRLEARNRVLEDIERENDALKALLSTLERDKVRLQEQLLALRDESERRAKEQLHLRDELALVEERRKHLSEEFVEIERRSSDLANLYVASYQLHGTLDRDQVLATIQEILANLVGTEEIAVFELADDGQSLVLLAANGTDPERFRSLKAGEGPIGRTICTGDVYLAEGGASEVPDLTACVPLKLGERVMGVIAIFRLLPQKQRLEELDHELFGLLATHAATALYCAALHARLSERAH